MTDDLNKVREIFVTGVDEETRAENLAQIQEWEEALTNAEAVQSWREHETTKAIAKQARETIVNLSLELVQGRSLPDAYRVTLFAQIDAAKWLLTITEPDAKAIITTINGDIKRALAQATS